MCAKHTITVPGRLCLTGEHSDWAAEYRLQCPTIPPGAALVVGLNHSITGVATAQEGRLSFESELGGYVEIPLGDALALARDTLSPWRFAAAVSYIMHTRFSTVGGLDVRLTRVTLPAARGFSSSAAICVLIARAFNQVYELGLTVAAEMDIAYAGERITGSACGRMDQIVAIGTGQVATMSFDVDFVDFKLVRVNSAIYIVVADLGQQKDTALILKSLQTAYPDMPSVHADRLRRYLGERNQFYVKNMESALRTGDAKTLGLLMTQAQEEFDQATIPFCPEQLTAPHLHAILGNPDIQPLIYGGKGVGSQGDGAVQFVAIDKQSAETLKDILERKLGTTATVVSPGQTFPEMGKESAKGGEDMSRNTDNLKKMAIIPTAGYGTRLFPASHVVKPKSLLPIIDADGFAKPILLHIVEQAIAACIQCVTIVTAPGVQTRNVREMFQSVPKDLKTRLKPGMQEYADRLESIKDSVDIVIQPSAEGLGHAVTCAVPNDNSIAQPLIVLLGDVIFKSQEGEKVSPVKEVLSAFTEAGEATSVIAVSQVPVKQARAYGVVRTRAELTSVGQSEEILEMIEKPSEKELKRFTKDGKCDIILGPYAFTPAVIKALKEDIVQNKREGGEIQLTSAMTRVMQSEGMRAIRLKCEALDTGNAQDYSKSFSALAATMN